MITKTRDEASQVLLVLVQFMNMMETAPKLMQALQSLTQVSPRTLCAAAQGACIAVRTEISPKALWEELAAHPSLDLSRVIVLRSDADWCADANTEQAAWLTRHLGDVKP